MPKQKLRVGVIGLGQIAQIMHLHYLHELPEIELAAVCDLSKNLVEAIGNYYGVARRYTNYHDLLGQADIDAVLITTRDHPPVAIDAANAGKHVITEKPVAFNLEDADRVIAAARDNKVKLMVTYMKRYDPAYQYALPLFKQMRDVRLIRVHDFGGAFQINNSIYDLFRADDIPADVMAEGNDKINRDLARAIGTDEPDFVKAYSSLLHLSTHDAIILRQAFGDPDEVLFADLIRAPGGGADALSAPMVVAVMAYGQARCVWQTGVIRGNIPWDESLAAYSQDRTVTVHFPFPYLRNAPTIVNVRELEGEAFVERNVTVSFDEAFKREWRHVYECITEDKQPITSGEEGRADVAMLIKVMQAVRR